MCDCPGIKQVRVSRGWRICFVWRDGDAWDVESNDRYG